MEKSKINLIVDTTGYFLLMALFSTGLLLWLVLPPGSPREGFTWLGLDRHAWGDVHNWLAVGFMVYAGLHLVLHAKWIWCMFTGTDKRFTRGRLAVTALLLAFALAIALLFLVPKGQSQDKTGFGRGHGAGWRSNQ